MFLRNVGPSNYTVSKHIAVLFSHHGETWNPTKSTSSTYHSPAFRLMVNTSIYQERNQGLYYLNTIN
jgi:hypothetical protein